MRVRKLTSVLQFSLEASLGFLLMVILTLSLGEVVSRWVTHRSLVFIAELNRFLFTWLVFLAVPAVQNRGEHFRMLFVSRLLPRRARQVLEVGVDAATLAFAVVLLTQGLEVVGRTSVQVSAALSVPMHYVYSVIPLSAVLMILFMVSRWARILSERQLPDPSDPELESIPNVEIDPALPAAGN